MASIYVNGYKIKARWFDYLIDVILCLWSSFGEVRKVPRNIYSKTMILSSLGVAIIMLPIGWLLMHVPFIWPEALAAMFAGVSITIGMRPYQDYFRAVFTLIVASVLLNFNITFNATIFGFHIEESLYYFASIVALLALWRRFFNWLCWSQIDRICVKYGIPRYDQKTLMDSYENYNTHYGEKPIIHSTYQEAITNLAVLENETNLGN